MHPLLPRPTCLPGRCGECCCTKGARGVCTPPTRAPSASPAGAAHRCLQKGVRVRCTLTTRAPPASQAGAAIAVAQRVRGVFALPPPAPLLPTWQVWRTAVAQGVRVPCTPTTRALPAFLAGVAHSAVPHSAWRTREAGVRGPCHTAWPVSPWPKGLALTCTTKQKLSPAYRPGSTVSRLSAVCGCCCGWSPPGCPPKKQFSRTHPARTRKAAPHLA